ncbi:hypothetical protein T265_04884 [Opisthorchis viverrini]|uniref:Uncharacterized protein n=1 Tax=Opisthorchis viverrini TaxID=6198 RepID=A0A074ZLJ4_OPIVI|nr:hypothetical protein T265_04884 [Opisthorchis viverrini]KER28208.1 hypothetical protein T265_04884 [Opisthorchis viverrini]
MQPMIIVQEKLPKTQPTSTMLAVRHFEVTLQTPSLSLSSIPILKQAGQQTALECMLDSLSIDVGHLSETGIQDPSTVVELTTHSVSVRFLLRTSGNPEVADGGSAWVDIVLNHRVKRSPLE